MPPFGPVLTLALAALASWLLLRALIPLLRRRLLDQPNARSAHQVPTPRGGGVAFVLVAAAAGVLAFVRADGSTLAVLPLLALPLALVGLLDDRHNLPASWRAAIQLATALGLVALSPLARALPGLLLPLGGLILLIAAMAVINFTNFMDGLDGLVASCLALALATAALQLAAPWPLWALVGALLGFLACNWSPAQVFMGDVGSTFLGAVFAGAVLQAPSWGEALGLLLVTTPLLGDACSCVLRRLGAGQPITQAHRLHLYQRLHQAGWPHGRVAGLYLAGTMLLALVLVGVGWPWVSLLAASEILLGMWLDQHVAISFTVASTGSSRPMPPKQPAP